MGPKFYIIDRELLQLLLFAESVCCFYCGFLFLLGSLGCFGFGVVFLYDFSVVGCSCCSKQKLVLESYFGDSCSAFFAVSCDFWALWVNKFELEESDDFRVITQE